MPIISGYKATRGGSAEDLISMSRDPGLELH